MKQPQKHHRFNLWQLEENALIAYASFVESDTTETRTHLFLQIKALAYAVVSVGKYAGFNLDYEEVSYEYALYLFERIVFKGFKLNPKIENGRFPLQNYVSLNIKSIIYNFDDNKNESYIGDIFSELEYVVSSDESIKNLQNKSTGSLNINIDSKKYGSLLMKNLMMYYNLDDIRRLLPICLEILCYNKKYNLPPEASPDIIDFCVILVSTSKRLCKDHNINFSIDIKKSKFSDVLHAATKSTVFLSLVANSNIIPKELLLSLDIDSLYRLVSLAGGQKIKIPTSRELDTLIGAATSIASMIRDGTDQEKALSKTKTDFGLVFATNININLLVSKMIESYSLYKEDNHAAPLINVLAASISSLDLLFKELQNNSDDLSADSIMSQYAALSSSFSKITESLVSIKANIKTH